MWAERVEWTAHLWGTEVNIHLHYLPSKQPQRRYDTQPLWWQYSYSEHNSHICFICSLLHTSNTISFTWINDFSIHYTGRSLEKERVLFMIWLWFMMGTTICALNNYRMILNASEGTIFPQSSNFNIKKEPTKQATVKRLQQDLCTPSNMNDCIKSNSKSQLSAMTASFALKHQSKSGVFFSWRMQELTQHSWCITAGFTCPSQNA